MGLQRWLNRDSPGRGGAFLAEGTAAVTSGLQRHPERPPRPPLEMLSAGIRKWHWDGAAGVKGGSAAARGLCPASGGVGERPREDTARPAG